MGLSGEIPDIFEISGILIKADILVVNLETYQRRRVIVILLHRDDRFLVAI